MLLYLTIIVHLLHALRIPVTQPTTEQVNKKSSDALAKSQDKRGDNEDDGGGDDPISATIL
jgi:hypothetical protein